MQFVCKCNCLIWALEHSNITYQYGDNLTKFTRMTSSYVNFISMGKFWIHYRIYSVIIHSLLTQFSSPLHIIIKLIKLIAHILLVTYIHLWFIYMFVWSLTQLLIHSLTHSLLSSLFEYINALIHFVTHSSTHSVTQSVTYSLTYHSYTFYLFFTSTQWKYKEESPSFTQFLWQRGIRYRIKPCLFFKCSSVLLETHRSETINI